MKELTLLLIKSIISHPEEVVVTEEIGEDGFIDLKVTVNPADMGEVIGKNGKIIKAVRSVLKAAALKNGSRFRLDLVDPTSATL